MGSTSAFKELDMSFNDFSFCVELPIKAKKKIIYWVIYHLLKDQG